MNFYRACMRCSSVILFWVAVVIFVVSVIIPFALAPRSSPNPYSTDSGISPLTIIDAIRGSVSGAFLPFFASALLYLLDARLPVREAAE